MKGREKELKSESESEREKLMTLGQGDYRGKTQVHNNRRSGGRRGMQM